MMWIKGMCKLPALPHHDDSEAHRSTYSLGMWFTICRRQGAQSRQRSRVSSSPVLRGVGPSAALLTSLVTSRACAEVCLLYNLLQAL